MKRVLLMLVMVAAGCELLPAPSPNPGPTETARQPQTAPQPTEPTARRDPTPQSSPQPRTGQSSPQSRTPHTPSTPVSAGRLSEAEVAQRFIARITPVRRGTAATAGLDPAIADGGWDTFIDAELADLRGFYGPHLRQATVVVVRPFGSFGGIFESDVPAKVRASGRDRVYRGMVPAYQRLADSVGTVIFYVGAPDNRPEDVPLDQPAAAWARLDETTALFREIRGSRRNVGVGLDASARWGTDSLSWKWAHRLRDEGFWPIVYEATGPTGNPWNATDMWCIVRDVTLRQREEMEKFAKPSDIRGPVLHGFQMADDPKLPDILAVFAERGHDARVYAALNQLRRLEIRTLGELTTLVNQVR